MLPQEHFELNKSNQGFFGNLELYLTDLFEVVKWNSLFNFFFVAR